MKAFGKLFAYNNMHQLIKNKSRIELWVTMRLAPQAQLIVFNLPFALYAAYGIRSVTRPETPMPV